MRVIPLSSTVSVPTTTQHRRQQNKLIRYDRGAALDLLERVGPALFLSVYFPLFPFSSL